MAAKAVECGITYPADLLEKIKVKEISTRKPNLPSAARVGTPPIMPSRQLKDPNRIVGVKETGEGLRLNGVGVGVASPRVGQPVRKVVAQRKVVGAPNGNRNRGAVRGEKPIYVKRRVPPSVGGFRAGSPSSNMQQVYQGLAEADAHVGVMRERQVERAMERRRQAKAPSTGQRKQAEVDMVSDLPDMVPGVHVVGAVGAVGATVSRPTSARNRPGSAGSRYVPKQAVRTPKAATPTVADLEVTVPMKDVSPIIPVVKGSGSPAKVAYMPPNLHPLSVGEHAFTPRHQLQRTGGEDRPSVDTRVNISTTNIDDDDNNVVFRNSALRSPGPRSPSGIAAVLNASIPVGGGEAPEDLQRWQVGITLEGTGTNFTADDFPIMEEHQCSSTEGEEEEEEEEEEEVQWRVVDGPGGVPSPIKQHEPDEEEEEVYRENDGEDPESYSVMTVEEAQRELNSLLERCEYLKRRWETLQTQCHELIPASQCEELYSYLKKTSEEDDASVTDEDLSKFVLGRIGLDKVEVVDKMHQMLALDASLEQNAANVDKAIAVIH